MWDTVAEITASAGHRHAERVAHLSHEMPCTACGHAPHTYLPCSDTCACVPPLPSVVTTVARLLTSGP